MFLRKALSWSPPELFYKVIWWRGEPPKKEEEGDEELVKEEILPPLATEPPGRAWLRWNFQVPSIFGYFRWWGHSAPDEGDGVNVASDETTFVKSEPLEPARFGVQDASPGEGMQWGLRRALRRTPRPPSDLETPEHYQICFNFIRHLVDLCVVSFLWLCSPVFRLGLDIVGLGGMVKLWLHGMAMFLVASYCLHLVFWLVQEYLLQFACLFGLLQVLVLSVSIQAGLEVEDDDGTPAKGGFVLGSDHDTDQDTPTPLLHSQEKSPPEHIKRE
ncbi:uncharacterized protein C6orf47 homolog [Lissotriton helveticus]